MPESWLVAAALVALAAGAIRGFSGFGSALTLVPGLSFIYGPAAAVPITLVIEVIGGLPMLWTLRRSVDWRRVALLGTPAVLAAPFGGLLLLAVPGEPMRRAIGALVLAVALVMLAGWRYRGKPRTGASLGVGFLSGLLNGAVGMPGPPVLIYQIASADGATATRAFLTAFFVVVDAATALFFVAKGALGPGHTAIAVALFLPTLAGVALGTRLQRDASEARFRTAVVILLAAIGAVTMLA